MKNWKMTSSKVSSRGFNLHMAQQLKHRVVICGSMSAYSEMARIGNALQERGVLAVLPVPEDQIKYRLTPEEFQVFKRDVSFRHLRQIRNPATFAVLAVNVDKHGIRDYIGPNTFAEIAVAFAQRKGLFLYQDVPTTYDDELSAWGALPLRGELEALINAFDRYKESQSQQLLLFEDEPNY
jgi:hypothetical protein